MIEFIFARVLHDKLDESLIKGLYKNIISNCDVISLEVPYLLVEKAEFLINQNEKIKFEDLNNISKTIKRIKKKLEDAFIKSLLFKVNENNKNLYCLERTPENEFSLNSIDNINSRLTYFFEKEKNYEIFYKNLPYFFEEYKKVINSRDINAMRHAKDIEQKIKTKFPDLPEIIKYGVVFGAEHSLDRRIFNKYPNYSFNFFLPKISNVYENKSLINSTILSAVFFNNSLPLDALTLLPNIKILKSVYEYLGCSFASAELEFKVFSKIFKEQYNFLKNIQNKIIDFADFNSVMQGVSSSKLEQAGFIIKEHSKDAFNIIKKSRAPLNEQLNELLDKQKKTLKKYALL